MGVDKEEKVIDLLYKQLTEHSDSIQRVLTIIEQLRTSDIDKTMSCSNTKAKFTIAINKLTSFMTSIQNQTEIIIKEVKSIKASVNEHDKKIFEMHTNLNSFMKDKEKNDNETKKVTDKLKDTTETLRDKVNKQEPYRMLILLICSLIVALVAAFNNISNLLVKLKEFFH